MGLLKYALKPALDTLRQGEKPALKPYFNIRRAHILNLDILQSGVSTEMQSFARNSLARRAADEDYEAIKGSAVHRRAEAILRF